MHRIEYESLFNVCFRFGRFGHNQDICQLKSGTRSSMGERLDQLLSKMEATIDGESREWWRRWMQ
ncbi:hypothetical protein Golax_019507 [Gossypium laxum]|uniref:Uncharacterized protein n=1 Tax=Gossypium laxum TaxID=34288 RepID=A0A7J8Z6L1_9ROSI|nr:hypothetical protein [Gossypium laxum]